MPIRGLLLAGFVLSSCNSILGNQDHYLVPAAAQAGMSSATAGSAEAGEAGEAANAGSTSEGNGEAGASGAAGGASGMSAGTSGAMAGGGASAGAPGACSHGQTHSVACGNCGTNLQTCSSSGTWQDATCTGEGCAPETTRACNTYGTESCDPSCTWGACSCPASPVCVPQVMRCFGNAVQACDSCGQWGKGAACTSAEVCLGGVCSPMFASCGSGLTTCAGGFTNCCASDPIDPNGTFYRSYVNAGSGPTSEADPATVSSFRLDRLLVTVARFREFVNAWNNGAGWLPPAGSGIHTHLHGGQGLSDSSASGSYESGWLTADDSKVAPTDANLHCDSAFQDWTATTGMYESLPINCANWYEAYAFCIWDGGFLPSEAEWEYAAAGGSLQREYPWGTTAPGMNSYYAISQCFYQGGGTCEGIQNIAPVGTAAEGAGFWGQEDLVGNVSEWTLDAYAAYASPCSDCATLSSPTVRVTRGGDFSAPPAGLVPWTRTTSAPANRTGDIGFRCARTP